MPRHEAPVNGLGKFFRIILASGRAARHSLGMETRNEGRTAAVAARQSRAADVERALDKLERRAGIAFDALRDDMQPWLADALNEALMEARRVLGKELDANRTL